MKYVGYIDGEWQNLAEDSEFYRFLKGYEKLPKADELIKNGFNSAVMLRSGMVQNRFLAKVTAGFPKYIQSLIDAVFPFFFTNGGISESESLVGEIELNEDKGNLCVHWSLGDGDWEILSVPMQVNEEVIRQYATWADPRLPVNELFKHVPNCLKHYFSSMDAVNNRRYEVLKNGIIALNKSLQLVGSNAEISSIKIFAEVSPTKGISTYRQGYGYRLLGFDETDLVYFTLGSGYKACYMVQ